MSSAVSVLSPKTQNRSDVRWFCYAIACLLLLSITTVLVRQATVSFGTYWASGRAMHCGENPYGVYPETFRSNFSFFGGSSSFPDVNLNPPSLLPLFYLVSELSIAQAVVVWTICSVVLIVVTAGLLVWSNPNIKNLQIFWLLCSASVLDTIACAQIYGLLLFLSGLAWLLHRRGKHLPAAVAIGLMVSLKPTMIFWPVFLFFAGHRRVALGALAVIALMALLPMILYGPGIYLEWFAPLQRDEHWVAPINVALIAYFRRLGSRNLGFVVAFFVAAGLAGWSWKKKPSFDAVSGVAICAGIFCAPLGWYSYVLMVAPFFVSRPWNRAARLAAVLLFIPTAVALLVHCSVIYTIALAIILLEFLGVRTPQRGESALGDREAVA